MAARSSPGVPMGQASWASRPSLARRGCPCARWSRWRTSWRARRSPSAPAGAVTRCSCPHRAADASSPASCRRRSSRSAARTRSRRGCGRSTSWTAGGRARRAGWSPAMRGSRPPSSSPARAKFGRGSRAAPPAARPTRAWSGPPRVRSWAFPRSRGSRAAGTTRSSSRRTGAFSPSGQAASASSASGRVRTAPRHRRLPCTRSARGRWRTSPRASQAPLRLRPRAGCTLGAPTRSASLAWARASRGPRRRSRWTRCRGRKSCRSPRGSATRPASRGTGCSTCGASAPTASSASSSAA
mmetsp:Transcript_75834/g.214410  ORF Transcript_75834/g.214410 Transcript_75834/m.214410 type:complete len:298 (-) Transcript_75834:1215-2108(-)